MGKNPHPCFFVLAYLGYCGLAKAVIDKLGKLYPRGKLSGAIEYILKPGEGVLGHCGNSGPGVGSPVALCHDSVAISVSGK